MTVVLHLSDDQAAALAERAAEQGLTLEDWLKELAAKQIAPLETKPLKSAYGLLAQYGPAPSAEEIDANRADMVRGFAEDF